MTVYSIVSMITVGKRIEVGDQNAKLSMAFLFGIGNILFVLVAFYATYKLKKAIERLDSIEKILISYRKLTGDFYK